MNGLLEMSETMMLPLKGPSFHLSKQWTVNSLLLHERIRYSREQRRYWKNHYLQQKHKQFVLFHCRISSSLSPGRHKKENMLSVSTVLDSLEEDSISRLLHISSISCCNVLDNPRINCTWLITMNGMKRRWSSLESRTIVLFFSAQSLASMLCPSKEEKNMLYKSNSWFVLGTYSFIWMFLCRFGTCICVRGPCTSKF